MEKELNITIPEGYEVDKEKSTFEKIIFKKKTNKYPKSWNEFCKEKPVSSTEYYIDYISTVQGYQEPQYRRNEADKNLCKTKEEAEAFLTLIQLKRLWHEYTYDWEKNLESVWSIGYTPNSGFLLFNTYLNNSSMFFFPNKKLAEEFLYNFKDLFEKLKPLYG